MLRLCLVVMLAAAAAAEDLPPSCEKPVYCNSSLLHRVQLAHLYHDSKIFVDMRLVDDPNTTLTKFETLLNNTNNAPTNDQLKSFVEEHFAEGDELLEWTPPDHVEDPAFLKTIRDETLRQYAKNIHHIWPTLGRKVKDEVFQNPDRFSFIPVSHGFVIPGGRFTELYYWDTYWIIQGLLVGGMKETTKGVIENLIELLQKLGHIPNGSRWYYQERSQPPMLTAMVARYVAESKDKKFLYANIEVLESELNYWLDTQTVTFEKDDKSYTLLHYFAASDGPRPESYREDYENAQYFGDDDDRKSQFYVDMKSAAESGWDFSSRWFINDAGDNTGNITSILTRSIIPVDLNSFFANALQNIAYFHGLLGHTRKAAHWAYVATQWRSAIEEVLWNEDEGIWFDYDIANDIHRKYFYPSSLTPLAFEAVEQTQIAKHADKIISYLQKSKGLDFPGGVPTSLIRSGEQWDFPNAWPPLVSIVVNALEAIGTPQSHDMAFEVAQTWVRANLKGYDENKQMFEKYDAEVPGRFGGGGEYVVQDGFGWSNGVVLEFLAKYGSTMTASDESVRGLDKERN